MKVVDNVLMDSRIVMNYQDGRGYGYIEIGTRMVS